MKGSAKQALTQIRHKPQLFSKTICKLLPKQFQHKSVSEFPSKLKGKNFNSTSLNVYLQPFLDSRCVEAPNLDIELHAGSSYGQ